jgi:L-alanine-DL-glutamate epimerase-like enolase superfamily enzyme
MKVTGYRSLTTTHDWGRLIGDANGVMATPRTEVHVLILETDRGLEGVGVGAHADVERVFPAVENQDPRAAAALYDRMLARVFKSGHSGATFGAIGAIDMALWDLKAKAADEPLWRTLGALDRFVPGYASGLEIALDDTAVVELYERFADRGFTAGKLKGGLDLDHDRRRLEALRDVLGRGSSHPALMFDANESWNRSQAVRFVSALERTLDLAWIEEPVRRWDAAGLASVRRGVRAGVATGENLTGLEQYRPLLDADAVDVVQVGNVWGITHFLRVAALAHAYDLPVSPVSYHANPLAHAAAAVPNHLAFEVQDLTAPLGLSVDQEYMDGGIVLGDEPGLGIRVDEAHIDAARAADPAFAPAGPHVRPGRAGLRLVLDSASDRPDRPDRPDQPDRPDRSELSGQPAAWAGADGTGR